MTAEVASQLVGPANNSAELSKNALLARRLIRPQTYWRAGHAMVDSLVRYPKISELVEQQAASRGDNFYLVQIGANDGQRADPVNHLIKKYNLQGLLVEPVPRYHQALRQTYADSDRLKFAQVAVSHDDGEATLYAVNPDNSKPSMIQGSSSLDRDVISRSAWTVRNEAALVQPITVQTQRLATLLAENEVIGIDYMVVDTEGHDGVVVNQALDLDESLRPSLLFYEHMHLPRSERRGLESRLDDAGYSFMHLRRDTFAWQPDIVAVPTAEHIV